VVSGQWSVVSIDLLVRSQFLARVDNDSCLNWSLATDHWPLTLYTA
jgi:hypothetical protein